MPLINGNNELLLYGFVGADQGLRDWLGMEGFTALEVVTALSQLGDDTPITVRINSGGGFAEEGLAIYSALRAHRGEVSVIVDSIAASAASVIAVAGDSIKMRPGALFMIHEPWGGAVGSADDLMKGVNALNAFGNSIAGRYAEQTGRTTEEERSAMRVETWLSAEDAVAQGYADALDGETADEVMAFDYRSYSKAPERLFALADAKSWGGRMKKLASYSKAAALLENGAAVRGALKPQAASGGKTKYKVGDRVTVKAGSEHDDMTKGKTGTVKEIGTEALGVLFDGMQDIHHWYVDAEVNPAENAMASIASPRAATADWQCGADRDLPINIDASWDGAAAAARVLDWAGIGDEDPEPADDIAKARRAFLAYDAANASNRGSYKLPFADIVNGELTAIAEGIRNAASRLPQTDIPQNVKDEARAVLDHYEQRMQQEDAKAKADPQPPTPPSETPEQLAARRDAERDERAANIAAACQLAGMPDKAAALIKSSKSVDEVRAEIQKLRLEIPQDDISARHRPSEGDKIADDVPSSRDIYAARAKARQARTLRA